MGDVRRVGDTVHRPAGNWTPTVHAYLDHLHARGIRGIPRPVGITGDREVLSFVDGDVPVYPLPAWVRDESILRDGAAMLRRLHDATTDIDLSSPLRTWQQPARTPQEVVCHNDFAPHNLVFDADRRLVGVIDFDMCSPGPRLHDLAYFAQRAVPLEAPEPGLPQMSAAERERRIRIILDAYGTDATVRDLLSAAMIRLDELADFTDAKAVELGRPDLAGHAYRYRVDARYLGSGLG